MSAVDNKTVITLKGSVEIVSEFFFTAINSILYQRGIYAPDTFSREAKYGLTVLKTTDEGLLSYLQNVMDQLQQWLLAGDVQKLVVVVAGIDSGETLERWQFNVALEGGSTTAATDKAQSGGDENMQPATNDASSSSAAPKSLALEKMTSTNKSMKEIEAEIAAIIRQVTASVTFLPLLTEPCSFDLLIYTNRDAQVPQKWYDSDPCYILNSNQVKLRSFTTSIHNVDTMVTYKEADDWEL